VAENYFDERIAATYEAKWPELFAPAVVDPAVSFLADLARSGTALELGIGTGRLALPLSRRGIRVHGIELSPAMAARLQAEPEADGIGVTIGDFATATASGKFGLAYLVRNTIMNLTTQDAQVECFRNAAGHLEPGGCFVIEVIVPELQRLPPGKPSGRSPSPRGISASTSTTLPPRALFPTTTGSTTASSRPSRRHSATSGPPSLTSWRGWPE
jgi:SAM-dependent methyltransferase